MAWQIQQFDGVALPLINPNQDHSGAQIESGLQASVGSTFDYFGTRQRRGQQQQVSITGTFEGRTFSIVDHLGNFLVDQSGRIFITGTDNSDLRMQIDALNAKKGVQAQLGRYSLDSNNTRQWITARLLRVDSPQEVTDRTFKATLSCIFESKMDAWRATTQSITSLTTGNTPGTLNVWNGGNVTIEDSIISVTHTGAGTFGSIRLVVSAIGVDWTYSGTLTTDSVLVIDCGAQTVRVNGANAFTYFTLNAGHTARGWLPLAVGNNMLELAAPGDTVLMQVSRFDQWL